MQPLGVGSTEASLLRTPWSSMAMQLAGLDLAHEAGADDVQRRGLARHDPPELELAEHQRAHPVGVARGIERVLVHEDERERAAQHGQHVKRAASRLESSLAFAASRLVIRSLSVVAPIGVDRW